MSPLKEIQPAANVEAEIQSKKRKSEASTTIAKKPRISELTPTPSIRVDPELYQAFVGPYVKPSPIPASVADRDVREEAVWIDHGFNDVIFDVLYWPAINRQYDGHLPQEKAMEHLMVKKMDVLKALETIDEVVRGLPEPVVSMMEIRRLYLEPIGMDHHVEEEAADWDPYLFSQADCKEFFEFRRRGRPSDPQDLHVDFEPRWACRNCTGGLRQHSGVPRLCHICKTYAQLSRGVPRPLSVEPHFYEQELRKIREWKKMEKREKRMVPRMEFEREQEKLETQRLDAIREMRYPREELPKEDVAMVKRMWNARIERVKRVNRMRPLVNKAREESGKEPLPILEIPARFESLSGAKFAELMTIRRPEIQKAKVQENQNPKTDDATESEPSTSRRKRTCASIYARKP